MTAKTEIFTPRINGKVRLKLEIWATDTSENRYVVTRKAGRAERYVVTTTDGHRFLIRRAACGQQCRCDALVLACIDETPRRIRRPTIDEKFDALRTALA